MQKNKYFLIVLCLSALLFSGCKKPSHVNKNAVKPQTAPTIYIYSYGDFPQYIADNAIADLKKVYPADKVVVKGKLTFPENALYKSERVGHKRLWAPALLKYQDSLYDDNSIVLAFTTMDIASNVNHQGKVDNDWGIFGLGSQKWHSCICSLYRMSKKSDRESSFSKLVQHELGHCFGLPHCKHSPTCILSDAEKKYHLPRLTDYCSSCKRRLSALGWTFTNS